MTSENSFFNPENYFNKLSNKNDKNKLSISFNRIAFIFFCFVLILIIFSLKAFYLTGKKLPEKNFICSKRLNIKYIKYEILYFVVKFILNTGFIKQFLDLILLKLLYYFFPRIRNVVFNNF